MDISIKQYLLTYKFIWDDLTENNTSIPCQYDPLVLSEDQHVYIDSDSVEHKMYLLFKNNTNKNYSCFIMYDHVPVDQWPIYIFSNDDEIELVGNFRHYVQLLLNVYSKKYMNLQLLRSALIDIKNYSKNQVYSSLWLSKESIVLK